MGPSPNARSMIRAARPSRETAAMRLALLAMLALHGLAGASPAWQALPGTRLWDRRGDPAADMVEGIHRYLDRRTADGVARRAAR